MFELSQKQIEVLQFINFNDLENLYSKPVK